MRHMSRTDARIIRVNNPFWWYRAGRSPETVFRDLLKSRTWRRHPAPFAKTRRGQQRRAERRFVIEQTCGFGCD